MTETKKIYSEDRKRSVEVIFNDDQTSVIVSDRQIGRQVVCSTVNGRPLDKKGF